MNHATPTPHEARALLRALTRALATVGLLAALFTAVNVTLFAHSHGVPWPIAILLDPMTALALAAVLLADARLASWGMRPPAWSAALRWFTGTAATLMNTWTSLWPDGRIGWPRQADVAGVVLHTVPPVLLVLLAETVAAYRHRIARLQNTRIPLPHGDPLLVPQPGSTPAAGDTRSTLPTGAPPLPTPAPAAPAPAPSDADAIDPSWPRTSPYPQAALPDAVAGSTFGQALRLDAQHRSRTGHPMSIRQLKTALHVGHARAKELRAQLDAYQAGTAPQEHPEPLPAQEHHDAERS